MNKVYGFEVDTVQDSIIDRVEFIGSKEREFVRYCEEGHQFRISLQDDGKTLKIFEVPNECVREDG